jgi:hypothetical protein
MTQSVEEHQEVPKEEAAVMTVGGLRKRHMDQNLAVSHHQKPGGRIQASLASQKRLAFAGGMTQKEHSQKRQYQSQCGTRNPEGRLLGGGVNEN